jgi:hypothetical protein
MAVHFPESEDSYDSYDRYLREWAPAGKAFVWGNSILAAGVATAAMFKKKRTYAQLSLGAPNEGSVIVQEPAEAGGLPQELRPSSEKSARVTRLFNLTAENYYEHRGILSTLGEEIERDAIHPYAFLMAISPIAIQLIFRLRLRAFLLWYITDGISRGMQRERESLERLLPHFARVMQKESAPIRQLIQAADWQGLLRYLFDIPS